MKVKDLCKPAYVYFIMAVIHILMYSYMIIEKTRGFNIQEYNHYSLMGLILQIVFSLFWVWALNTLCKWKPNGEKVAWFFVLLPFIFIGLIIIGISGGLTYLLLHKEKIDQLNNKVEEHEIVVKEIREGFKNDHTGHKEFNM